jgi:hypothetical protein
MRRADNLTAVYEPVGELPHIMIILVLMRVNHFIYTMYTIYTEVASNE